MIRIPRTHPYLISAALCISVSVLLWRISAQKNRLYAASLGTLEAESGVVSGTVQKISDSSASGGQFITFASAAPTATARPTATPIPSANFQPTAPYYATFFYPWYETAASNGRWSQWTDLGHTPPTNWFSEYLPDPNPSVFDPSTELYSSTNDATIYWQLRKLAEAKQEVAISSWWSQGHKTDTAFRKILTDVMNRADNPYPNLRWAPYYECEGNTCNGTVNPSVSQLTADLNYIASNYATQKGFLKIGGKPVIFVYGEPTDGGTSDASCSDGSLLSRWSKANAAASTHFYIVQKVFTGYASSTCQPDSWHQYAPAVRTDQQGSYAYMVSPGFWLNGSAERLPRDATAFENGVKAMVSSNTTWKLVETWNEWGEGSGVEPAEQVNQTTTGTATLKVGGYPFKNLYVDILNRNLPPLE